MIKTYPYQQAKQFQKTFTGMKFQPYFNPLTGFDICKFDEDYKKIFGNYEDENGDGAFSDAVTARFGESATTFIRSLIDMGGII
jgi:hypothetical protein